MFLFSSYFFNSVHDDLTTRQSILNQMLIDTTEIDHLRVNFASNFNTENNTIIATNEINDIIDKYPKAMTTQIRQWLTEQQKNRVTAPLATVDTSKSIDDFDEYLKEVEENIRQYEQNEPNEIKLKVNKSFNEFPIIYLLFLYRKFFNKLKNDQIYQRISIMKIKNVSKVFNNDFYIYKNDLKLFKITPINQRLILNKLLKIQIY